MCWRDRVDWMKKEPAHKGKFIQFELHPLVWTIRVRVKDKTPMSFKIFG